MPTWRELLAGSELPRSEARLLAVHASDRDPAWLAAHDTDRAEPDAEKKLGEFLSRRATGEPIAYILGEREFFGLSLHVSPDVLIPRPETELLVELALEKLPKGGRFLDVGTGSGAIAIAVARHRPDAQIFASDISAEALKIAAKNAHRHDATVQLVQGDGLSPFGHDAFDVIATNPPYIAEADPHLKHGDLRFEPQLALHSGPDGLNLIRRLAKEARFCLKVRGWLMSEHGYDQSCASLWAAAGYESISEHKDLAGIERVCAGRKPG